MKVRSHESLTVGSHVPVLEYALTVTTGPILEFGGGHWSTPVLRGSGRPVTTIEPNERWAGELKRMFPGLDLRPTPPPVSDDYDFIFFDHDPEDKRLPTLEAWRGHFRVGVVHDVGPKDGRMWHYADWREVAESFPSYWWYIPTADQFVEPTLFVSETPGLEPESIHDGKIVH